MQGPLRWSALALTALAAACRPSEGGHSPFGQLQQPALAVATTRAELELGGNLESGVEVVGDSVVRQAVAVGVTGWQSGPALRVPRFAHGTAVYNGFVYAVSGCEVGDSAGGGCTALTDAVEYAPIGLDGALGSWSDTTPVPRARFQTSAVAYNGHLYLVAGDEQNGADSLVEVHHAPINADGTLGTWQVTTPLPARWTHVRIIAYRGFLYLLGGTEIGFGITARVLVAPFLAQGGVGAWVDTTPFPAVRRNQAVAAHNGFVYSIGGFQLSEVLFAPVLADGALGAWQATTPLPSATQKARAFAHRGHLYLVGGNVGAGTGRIDVYTAVLHADGRVGAWTTTTSLQTGRDALGAVVYRDSVYVVGGGEGTTVYGSTEVGALDATPRTYGALGAWSTTSAMLQARAHHGAAACDRVVYVAGGNTPDSEGTSVEYARVGEGALGPWTGAPPLPAKKASLGMACWNGHVYVSGGFDGSDRVDDLLRATVAPDGSLDGWTSLPPLPSVRDQHGSLAYRGRLYLAGGRDAAGVTAAVDHAAINADGSIGAWQSTQPLPAPTTQVRLTAYDGHLYAAGGSLSAGSFVNSVHWAAIQPDGGVGPWTTASFTLARDTVGAVAHAGYLYIVGGCISGNCTGGTAEVEVAPIRGDGSLGAFASTTSLPASRRATHAVAADGFVYQLAGFEDTIHQSTVFVAALAAPVPRGEYSRVFDLGFETTVHTVTAGGDAAREGSLSLSYRTALTDGVLGAPTEVDRVTPGDAVPVGLTARYVWVHARLDDTSASHADSADLARRDLSDLTVEFGDPDPGPDGGVEPDAGVKPDPVELGVGCGCSHGLQVGTPVLMLVLLGRSRARRARNRPSRAQCPEVGASGDRPGGGRPT